MKPRCAVRLASLIALLLTSGMLRAQDSDEQAPALGDVARQTRTPHMPGEAKSQAQGPVGEMQREEEESENAPVGFESYNAGEYRLFVPFPYSLEGRENGGAVLLGSRLGVTNAEVMAGAPVPIEGNKSDGELMFWARQLADQHGQAANCAAFQLGEHKAFRCWWSGAPNLLGRQVWGSMVIVQASNSLIPIMCVSPDDLTQCATQDQYGYRTCNTPHPSGNEVQQANARIQTRYRDEMTAAQVCDQVIYPSIHLKEDTVVHPSTIAARTAPQTTTVDAPAQNASLATEGTQTESLGDLARETRQAPPGEAHTQLDNAEGSSLPPKGFQSFPIQFCLNPRVCGEASVVIPEKAEVVSRVNGQHIFKTALDGESMMLYAGPADVNAPYRSMTNGDFIRIRDLANSHGWSRETVDSVSTQEMNIDGLPALMTRFRYHRDPNSWWIGERALIEVAAGVEFLVGCTAREQHFSDAEVLCTTLVNSLRLP